MKPRPDRKRVVLDLFVATFVSLTALGASPSLSMSQNKSNETDNLVRQLAEKFTDTDKKGIVVMDLESAVGPSGSFGSWIGDQISTSLAAQGNEVVSRSKLVAAIEAQHVSPPGQSDVKNAVALAKSIGASTVIVGSYGAAENGLGVSLAAFRVSEYGNSQSMKFMIGIVFGKIPLTNEINGHLGVALDSLRPRDGIYRSGYGGVSIPSCIKCPVPSMRVPDIDLKGMLSAHPQGATVWLNFVVTEDGHTRNVSAPQPVGFGFDEQYVKAAKDWELKPAVNADNKPVPVNYVYHVSFNFK